jgi:hypothetical protein
MERAEPKFAAHVAGCEACSARVARLKAASQLFDREVFPATVDRVRSRYETRSRLPWWLWLAPVPAAAIAALIILRPAPPPEDVIGIRGAGFGFQVLGNAGGTVAPLANGSEVPVDAALRFSVAPSKPCWVTVISVAATGEVSRLFPASGDGALVKDAGPLPGGAMLDGPPGPERIFAICSEKPLPFATIAQAAGGTSHASADSVRQVRGIDGLDGSVIQSTLLLEKRPKTPSPPPPGGSGSPP